MGMEQRWFHFASEHLLKHILLRYAEEMMPTLNGKYNIKAVSNIIEFNQVRCVHGKDDIK